MKRNNVDVFVRLAAVAVLSVVFTVRAADSLSFVDPLIGTEGDGSEYGGMQPYTCEPFGSFHAVPMTRTNRIGRLSFNASDKMLLGIILTRQPAIWMGDWGEVRVTVPPAKIEKLDAKPYLTRVTAGGRTYEYTATAHTAWIRGLDAAAVAAFPESGINTNRMDAKYGYPLSNFGGRWFADKSCPGELKIGLSLISVDQAKANLAAEIGARTFDAVVAETKARWEEMFARVGIDAPEDVKTIFYTGLYHTLLYPRRLDEGGLYYSAFDDKVHEGTRYNCFSLWDTYRAEHPWLTLIASERVDGMMQSLVDMYTEGGWLPKWPNPSYTGIMIGAPAEIVLQETRAKGFMGFDWATAQEAIKKNATVPQAFDTERRWQDRGQFGRAPETRAGLTSYLARGYVACDETAESVSRTQDFALADRNKNYTNLWCAAEGMFLPRRKDGSFVSRKDLKPPYRDYCEQQPETGVWAVPHDPEGLAELMGGKQEAIRRLDEFFDTIFFKPDGRGNGSIHGNETSHHCAYLYNRFGAPEKTQQRVRQILTQCYSTNRKGFDGNEDCGQMSAWYILSALGFYPLDPVSGEYEIGSPLVKSATLKIGAATLRIKVKGYSPDRWRVKSVTFNGKPVADWKIRHADIAKGGELVFVMCDNCVVASEPVASWSFDEGDANPVYVGKNARIVSGYGRGKSLRLDSPRARASAKAVDAVPDISSTERPFTAMIRIRPDADVVSDTMASMAKMCNSRRMTKFVEAMRDGQWHHVALVFDPTQRGKEYTVYFDWDDPKSPRHFTSVYPKDSGAKLTLPLVAKNSSVAFGGSISWGFYSLAYKGLIDDVVLFSTPLASEEIATAVK